MRSCSWVKATFAFSEENQFRNSYLTYSPRYRTPNGLITVYGIHDHRLVTNTFLYAATLSAITRVIIYGIVCIALIQCAESRMAPRTSTSILLEYHCLVRIAHHDLVGIDSKMRELRDVGMRSALVLLIYCHGIA